MVFDSIPTLISAMGNFSEDDRASITELLSAYTIKSDDPLAALFIMQQSSILNTREMNKRIKTILEQISVLKKEILTLQGAEHKNEKDFIDSIESRFDNILTEVVNERIDVFFSVQNMDQEKIAAYLYSYIKKQEDAAKGEVDAVSKTETNTTKEETKKEEPDQSKPFISFFDGLLRNRRGGKS